MLTDSVVLLEPFAWVVPWSDLFHSFAEHYQGSMSVRCKLWHDGYSLVRCTHIHSLWSNISHYQLILEFNDILNKPCWLISKSLGNTHKKHDPDLCIPYMPNVWGNVTSVGIVQGVHLCFFPLGTTLQALLSCNTDDFWNRLNGHRLTTFGWRFPSVTLSHERWYTGVTDIQV